MFVKKLGAGALLAMALAVSAQGATVSFMVIETGIREEIPTADSSRLWEYALLDVFFDTGHIVSNAPILRAAEKPGKNLPDEARSSLSEALEGGAEFFVVAVLEYQNPPQGGTADLRPRNISLRLFKTAPYRFMYSQEYAAPDLRAAGMDEVKNAMQVARALAAHLRD
ncbi:MAG: hypothetical protein LBG14_05095 [Treponema sp.]|jgi:hypothetical protein|nr:hypothetical protein [Treponema sp.]